MKSKLILVSLALLVVISLVITSCGGTTPAPAPPAPPAPAPPTPAPPAPVPPSAPQVFEWTGQCFHAAGDVEMVYEFPKLFEMIEKNTNGRVKMTMHPSGAIVNPFDELQACRDGILDFSKSSPSYWSGLVPAFAVESQPFSFRDWQDAAAVCWAYGIQEALAPAYEEQGVHLLNLHPSGVSGLGIFSAKPVKTLADMKGMKLRTWGSFLPFWKELGLSTVTMPLAESPAAVATGVLDAMSTSYATGYNQKLYDVAKYLILPPMLGSCLNHLVVNQKKWDELPDDLKIIVTETTYHWQLWMGTYGAPTYEVPTLKKLQVEGGMTPITLPEADQAKMLEVAIKGWDELAAKDALSAQVVGIMKQYFKDVGRLK